MKMQERQLKENRKYRVESMRMIEGFSTVCCGRDN
jgi:hypothetical protein